MSSFNRRDDLSNLQAFGGSLTSIGNPVIGAVIHAYLFLLSTGGLPARLLLRKNMGERSFTPFSFILAFIIFTIYGFLVHFIFFTEMLAGIPFPFQSLNAEGFIENSRSFLYNLLIVLLNPYLIFLAFIFSKATQHFKRILNNARASIYDYSFSKGESVYFEHKKGKTFWGFKVDDKLIRMIYEPLGVFKFSLVMLVICICITIFRSQLKYELSYIPVVDYVFTGFVVTFTALIISAILLFLDEFNEVMKFRNNALSIMDSDIEMKKVTNIQNELQKGNAKQGQVSKETNSISSASID